MEYISHTEGLELPKRLETILQYKTSMGYLQSGN